MRWCLPPDTPVIRTPADANPAVYREREETGPIFVRGIERRPFFVEGSEIFRYGFSGFEMGGSDMGDLFYSRRIGRARAWTRFTGHHAAGGIAHHRRGHEDEWSGGRELVPGSPGGGHAGGGGPLHHLRRCEGNGCGGALFQLRGGAREAGFSGWKLHPRGAGNGGEPESHG